MGLAGAGRQGGRHGGEGRSLVDRGQVVVSPGFSSRSSIGGGLGCFARADGGGGGRGIVAPD